MPGSDFSLFSVLVMEGLLTDKSDWSALASSFLVLVAGDLEITVALTVFSEDYRTQKPT